MRKLSPIEQVVLLTHLDKSLNACEQFVRRADIAAHARLVPALFPEVAGKAVEPVTDGLGDGHGFVGRGDGSVDLVELLSHPGYDRLKALQALLNRWMHDGAPAGQDASAVGQAKAQAEQVGA